jgi:hypothetical protein
MLGHFGQALEEYKDELNSVQLWRYRNGKVPRILLWIVQRPPLARALLDDALALSNSENTTPDGEPEPINTVS